VDTGQAFHQDSVINKRNLLEIDNRIGKSKEPVDKDYRWGNEMKMMRISGPFPIQDHAAMKKKSRDSCKISGMCFGLQCFQKAPRCFFCHLDSV
jgi:hypothetical protein